MNGFTDEFKIKITERVIEELKNVGLTQNEFLRLCDNIGISISQSSLSKIYAGGKIPNLAEMTAISKVVGKSIDYFMWGDDCKEDFCETHNSVLHNSGEELEIYKGIYNLYYISTAVGENKLLHGILNVQEGQGVFCLELGIHTGETDKEGNRIIKQYVGRILTCSRLGAAYLIFKSESIGEMCMICLRHRSYSTMEVAECRVGLALTISAGEKKEPVVHRCVLIREELDKERIEKLRPWLNMINDDIRIEKNKWERLIEDLKKRYNGQVEEIEKMEKYALHKEYMELDAGVLQKQLSTGQQALEFLSELYKIADNEKNYIILSDDDIRVYKRIVGVEDGGEVICLGAESI